MVSNLGCLSYRKKPPRSAYYLVEMDEVKEDPAPSTQNYTNNARVFGFLSVNSPSILEYSRPGVYQYLILDFLIIAVMIAMRLSQYFILSIRTNCDAFMAIPLNHAQLLDYLIP